MVRRQLTRTSERPIQSLILNCSDWPGSDSILFPLQVQLLRERREDITALTTQFLRAASRRLGRTVAKVPQREMAKLVAYDWPGNVRELQHVVERAMILAPTGRAIQFDVTPSPAPRSGLPAPVRPYRTEHEWRRMERDNLLAVLKAARGKVTGPGGAAALLGVNPNTLASRLRVLGLKKIFIEQRDASR